MSFYIGQKVVCVDDSNFKNPHLSATKPVTGRTYTIRGFTPCGNVLLCEVVNPPHYWIWGYGEGGWFLSRFRPLDALTEQIAKIEADPRVEPEPQYA